MSFIINIFKAVWGYLAAFLLGSERQKRKQEEHENDELREGQKRWANRPSLTELIDRLRKKSDR